jgi:hypothetical protein
VPYPVNPITARIVTGYSTSKPIPKTIKQAIMLYAGFFDRNRDFVDPSDETLKCVDRLINQYRVSWFGR